MTKRTHHEQRQQADDANQGGNNRDMAPTEPRGLHDDEGHQPDRDRPHGKPDEI